MTYLGAIDEMIFKVKLEKDKVLRMFHTDLIYKKIPLFIGVRIFDGKVEVAIITLLASFKFSGNVFINHCSANMLQTKKTPIRKTKIKIPW